jgi:hypothetical protein
VQAQDSDYTFGLVGERQTSHGFGCNHLEIVKHDLYNGYGSWLHNRLQVNAKAFHILTLCDPLVIISYKQTSVIK